MNLNQNSLKSSTEFKITARFKCNLSVILGTRSDRQCQMLLKAAVRLVPPRTSQLRPLLSLVKSNASAQNRPTTDSCSIEARGATFGRTETPGRVARSIDTDSIICTAVIKTLA